MAALTVDPTGTHLLDDGRPLPLIADTLWVAFADPTPSDWRWYLATRRMQGFTAAFVSIMPILHDEDRRTSSRAPFARRPSGHYDFTRIDEGFFEQAREYTRIAHEEFGIRLIITVLWNNFVEGTWGAALTPHAVLADDVRHRLLARVATAFADLQPIFAIGGDDHYTAPAANAAYLEAADHLRRHAPGCVLTTHSAPNTTLPDEIADALDFFLHQSGHNVENQELTWQQPEQYLARTPRKPVIASEPPYEQHGKVNGYGRWGRDDVRRASWTSVLAGAGAGIGYGAHGVWMWHTPGGVFAARSSSLEPLGWPEAMALPGALDISLMSRLFGDHRLWRLLPAQRLLVDDRGSTVRLATSDDRQLVALYLPFGEQVELRIDLTGYRITGWDLPRRAPVVPRVELRDGATILEQLPTPGDQLVIAERNP